MLAVHFGAGNIGRGFIGMLLADAGYEVVFVDVNAEVVDLLNERNEYRVVLASDNSEEKQVKGVRAINSMANPEAVVEAIAKADFVTTAVGPNILKIISGLVADGLKKRLETNDAPLNLVACENMVGGSAFLKENIYTKLNDAEKAQFDAKFAFPNSAVDRIVPNQVNEDKLMVQVEPFYEWVIEQSEMIGDVKEIGGVTYVNDLKPYIERKLFTVNTGHATAAYLGYAAGYEMIKEAMEDATVVEKLQATLAETGAVMVAKYGFDAEAHNAYINKIVGRFTNPHINDEVTRVARGPLRKLSNADRLISPASQYFEYCAGEPTNLVDVITAAMKYDFAEDAEAVELQAKIKELGYEKTIEEVCGLSIDSKLAQMILNNLK